MENLPKNEQVFVKEVAKDGNASKAVRKAFPEIKDPGYQRVKAHRLITDDNIVKAVEEVKITLAERFLDEEVAAVHKELMTSRKLDHMIFPMGPKEDDKQPELNVSKEIKTVVDAQIEMERTQLTDKDIEQLLTDANCVLRKIVHGRTARHVYFWAPDNMARDKAVDKVYKLKGAYAPEKSIHLNLDAQIDDEELIALANKLNGIARTTSNPGESVSSDGADTDPVDAEIQNQDQ